MVMVFNATFNNISVISWQSVLLVEETGGPGEDQNIQHIETDMCFLTKQVFSLSTIAEKYDNIR
jgi:hypothetical protein